ncbi:MBL fold metallo-hydrolase, partial [Rhizobium sp. Td3]
YPRLQAIDGEREIVPGVSIVDLTGHAATDVFFLFEQDRDAARAMRDRFFPRAAAEGALIAATHMPFPGLGRIVSDRGQTRWEVADWALQD